MTKLKRTPITFLDTNRVSGFFIAFVKSKVNFVLEQRFMSVSQKYWETSSSVKTINGVIDMEVST